MEAWITPNLVDSLAGVIDVAIALASADFGNIQLRDSEGKLRIVAQRNFPDWWLAYWESVAEGSSTCGTALAETRPVFVSDVAQSPIFAGKPSLEIQQRAGIRAVFSIPIRDKAGECLGMFSTHYRTSLTPSSHISKILELLADHAGMLILHSRTEYALSEVSNMFVAVFQNAPIAIGISTPQGIIERTNPAYSTLLGYSEEELQGMPAARLLHPEDSGPNWLEIGHLVAGETPTCEMENRYLRKDGAAVWVRKFISCLPDANGKLAHFLVMATDLNASKQAEVSLRENEEHLNLAFRATRDGIWDWNLETDGAFYSPRWKAMLGYEESEIEPHVVAWKRLLHPDDLPRVLRLVNDVIQSGYNYEMEFRLRHKDGYYLPILSRGYPVRSGRGGRINRIVGTHFDLTELRRAENQIREREAELTEAQRLSHIGSWYCDAESGATTGSPELLRIYGLDPASEAVPDFKDQRDRCHPAEDWERINALHQESLRTGAGYEVDVRVRRNDECIWATLRGEVVRDRTGRIIGMRGTLQDISQRKSAEEALRRSQERFRALVRASSDAVYLTNADWKGFRWVDGKAFLTESDENGEWLKKNVIPEDRAPVQAAIRTASASKSMFEVEYRAIHPDGSICWMLTRAVPILNSSGEIEEWFGMISDISSIKTAELALTASEGKYRAAIETTADGFLILDEAGRVLEANDSYVRQSGYDNEELRSLAFADLCSCDTPEEIDTILDTVRNSGRERFLIWLRNKSGSTLPAEINISFKHDEPRGRFYLFMQNVEEKMRLEKEAQEQRSAMDALVKRQVASQTVAAIAHELNQPLVAASAYGEVALEMARAIEPPVGELATLLERNIEQVHRAGASLHQLVAFLHKTEVEFSPLDINTTITRAVAILRENGTTPFKTVLKLAPNLPKIRGNELQIQKVVINLIQNGIEAMHDAGVASGAISVRVRTNHAGRMAQVTVSDTGPGLDVQNATKIFEPFFSTKSGGLGLGLAVSRAVVEAHGGQLWIDPKPGLGATFHFTLPYADE